MSNEKKIFEVEGITLYDVDGAIFAEVDGERNQLTFDQDDANTNQPLTRENVTCMSLYEDGGDRILPSDFFPNYVHYLENWENEDEYARDEIAEFLQDYFEDEINQGDENARDFWKDRLVEEISDEYEDWIKEHPDQVLASRKSKEAFLDDYLYGENGDILDYDEAMEELDNYYEDSDEDSDEE